MNRKICIVTGTRAEYGLLFYLIKAVEEDPELDLQLIATGMHLAEEFGYTYKEIEKDFHITKKIDIQLESDNPAGISRSMGLAQIAFGEAFAELKPDLVVVLGDRFEIFSVVSAAMIARIPVAHLHGGEATEGLIDEPIRHSITKMSQLHFTATEIYKKRVIQLGEQANRVFNVGALGIDSINQLKLLSKSDFEQSIGFSLGKKNLLVTFHPVTLEKGTARTQFQALLDAISTLDDTKVIFTKANSDTDGRVINQMIDEYVHNNPSNTIAFASLGQLRFLSALQYIDAVVGNSSSGLLEAPSFKIGTINIGDRQKGRIKADSVIDCQVDKNSVLAVIEKLYSHDFQANLSKVSNPYGKGGASKKIAKIIKSVELDGIIKKSFFDIEFTL